jgi:hypothetical protein
MLAVPAVPAVLAVLSFFDTALHSIEQQTRAVMLFRVASLTGDWRCREMVGESALLDLLLLSQVDHALLLLCHAEPYHGSSRADMEAHESWATLYCRYGGAASRALLAAPNASWAGDS